MSNLEQDLADLGVPAAGAPLVIAAEPKPETPLKEVGPETDTPMAKAWAKWRPEFAKAMDGGFHTVEAVEKLVFQNRAQFWPGQNAAVITEIMNYPGERAIQGTWSAGDMAEIITLIPGIEAFGRLMGCTSALIEGERGWTKVLEPHGYKPWSATLRKVL